jgi:hypothetical protein
MRKFRKLAALYAVLALMFCFTTVAYASGGEEPPQVTQVPVPEAVSKPNPFTPAGTGMVVNTATDEDGKQFYTITTPDKNVFYLVIDLQRETDNVYFLNAVTEKDLLALAEKSGDTKENETVVSTPKPESKPDTTATPETDTKPQSQSNTGMLLLVLAVVVIGGGAGYYFKIYRPKHQQADREDDFDYSEEADLYDADDTEQADELSAVEEDQDGDGEA